MMNSDDEGGGGMDHSEELRQKRVTQVIRQDHPAADARLADAIKSLQGTAKSEREWVVMLFNEGIEGAREFEGVELFSKIGGPMTIVKALAALEIVGVEASKVGAKDQAHADRRLMTLRQARDMLVAKLEAQQRNAKPKSS